MSAAVQEYALEIPITHVSVCPADDLEPGWGESALLDGRQIALYRTDSQDFFAASHHCPSSGAKVMARGILGDAAIAGQRVPTVACPLHKEIYRLDTGACLSSDSQPLPVHKLIEIEGQLWMEQRR
ncbi:nitrite reductase small subunit NirD [Glutamicibacter sp.]|jgi:nitrite reductase [NAD(P)H], small subunit|uniref:nitrite reductase small subunit NirD n=1 Tax=Glutamicibacter sp. TaxID=1931995 RepID=UPI002B48B1D7|nr:nitrite reductase small subunit NirD [Glutamicibacter sp.]HJX80070.1 nitrite reductase small subunit NirD [Glutamicibacter sp.]